MTKSVLILLSTYNGEKYIREQLESLYSQEGVDIHILVRDDGSTDSTRNILTEYNNKYGNITIYPENNIGANLSFFRLINYAANSSVKYDYYAYCDQDDVWFNNKLRSALLLLEESKQKYKLIFCAQCPTDANLIPIKEYAVPIVNSLGANIVSNHIPGCVQVFNRALLQKVNTINELIDFSANEIIPTYHDSWTSAVAYALGADTIFDKTARMYYRQHGSNAVGSSGGGKFFVIMKRIHFYLSKSSSNSKSYRCKCLQKLVWNDIPTNNRRFIDLCANYRDSIKKKIGLLFSKQLYEYGFWDNIGAFLMVTFNKF